jgi:hypothetical protein
VDVALVGLLGYALAHTLVREERAGTVSSSGRHDHTDRFTRGSKTGLGRFAENLDYLMISALAYSVVRLIPACK